MPSRGRGLNRASTRSHRTPSIRRSRKPPHRHVYIGRRSMPLPRRHHLCHCRRHCPPGSQRQASAIPIRRRPGTRASKRAHVLKWRFGSCPMLSKDRATAQPAEMYRAAGKRRRLPPSKRAGKREKLSLVGDSARALPFATAKAARQSSIGIRDAGHSPR
jgi:hypothetical protein